MSVIPIPSDSVDAFIARWMADWLKTADADLLLTLHRALRTQQAAAERVKETLASIPSLEAFATQVLEPALRAEGLADVDVRSMRVYIEDDVPMPSAAPRLHTPWRTLYSVQPLLTAALHNFHEADTVPSFMRRAHLQDAQGSKLALTYEAFARCCRKLDIGGQYQQKLRAQLFPKSRPPAPENLAREAVQRMLEESLRAKMDVAVRMARIKSELDEVDYLRLLPVFAAKPVVPAVTGVVTPRQLYLLGKRIHGVVTLELREHADGPLEGIVSWIPLDPQRAVAKHASWEAFYLWLAKRMRAPHYRWFFSRFISERDRPTFTATLERLIAASSAQAPAVLDGRHFAIETPLFAYLRGLQVDKMLDDARILAVPTADEAAIERHERLEVLKSAGLDTLNLAALFIPVLGEVMFAVAAVDVVSEVYKGYEDWRLGDRQGALDHLMGVAQNLAAGAVVGAVHVGVSRVLERVPFVDALRPLHEGEGRARLAHWPPSAHYLEGGGALMRRFDGALAQIPDQQAETLLRITGLDHEQLRHLHLQGEPGPARLRDAHERYELHASEPHLQGRAFERELAAGQDKASVAGASLIKVFPGLSVRGAEEILALASGAQIKALLDSGRVPLVLAERARWFLRESRVDRALMGFEHEGAVNADTQRVILGWIAHRAPWPASMRIELRLGEAGGRLVTASGDVNATDIRTIIHTEQGYQLADARAPVLGQGFLPCLIHTLDAGQQAMLGASQLTAHELGDRIARLASADRERTAKLMGLTPIAERYRPPLRIDSRVGYALSGGGESSRRAIRSGIHDIFPTLTDAQLDAYLRNLADRGVGLWDHLSQLQRQLHSLREALDTWQRQRVSFMDGLRRQRVANQIRRTWRRKTAGLAGDDFSLHIDGEEVGSLPSLPADIDFGHVRRLTLRNMALEQIEEDFLRRFTHLRELDLRNNQLTRLPVGLEQFTGLRSLHLAGNQIIVDTPGSQRLASLTSLQVLDLNYNPLGQVPDLSSLRHLREVSLRATGLQTLPDEAAMPWRGLVDMRENQIRQVTGHLRTLGARLQRLSLHDNPLDEASEASIASSLSDSPVNRSSSYHHAIADVGTFEEWLGSASEAVRTRRMQIWTQLAEEPQSADLFRFLADFAGSDDFIEHPRYYRARVWRILELCTDNTDVREAVFWQTQGRRTCEDRLLLILSQLEVRAHIALCSPGNGSAIQAEQALLPLGRSLYRLDQVDSIAARHIQELRRDPYAAVDDIEVYLAYRVNLAERLGLPAQPGHMNYPEHSRVTATQVRRAGAEVLAGENIEVLSRALAERDFWQEHVRTRYLERFEALAAPFHEQLEQAEREVAEAGEQRYLERAAALMGSLNAQERELYLELAREAYQREA